MDDRITQLLVRLGEGDPAAPEQLMTVIYEELKARARTLSARESGPLTLGTTGLLHEGYLRLLGHGPARFENRRHFFAAAGEAMRRILIERARSLSRQKRGAGAEHVPLDAEPAHDGPSPAQVLALDQLLDHLQEVDETLAAVVKLRWFGGLSVGETAEALDMSPRSVNRAWTAARAWLGARSAGDIRPVG
ncbi:MAG: hypothetical protein KDI75_10665 [Xanthomonadales bacterium]|nr:hypothetical protein [Xanthomonadales bacterium]